MATSDPTVRRQILPYAVALVVIALGATAFSGLFGLSQMQTLAAVGILGVGIYVVWTSQDDFSLPFWLTFIPLLVLLMQLVVPDIVVDAFEPVFQLVGVEPRALDAIQLTILAFAGAFTYWAVQFRAGSGSSNADTIAGKILGSGRDGRKGELTKLVDQYVTMARLSFAFAFAVTALILSQGGTLAAEAMQFIGDAPLVASNIASGLLGWAALGGTVPEWLAWVPGLSAVVSALAGLDPGAWLLIVVVVLGLAWGLREGVVD